MTTQTRRRRWPWMLSALALFGLAAWLMSRDDPERRPPVWERVELPRHMEAKDHERARIRRVLPEPPAATPGEPQPPPRPRDPLLAALPSEVKSAVVVMEANAIRHSPVGELLLDCLLAADEGNGLQRFRDEVGFDPLEAVDRVALADDSLIVSGHFGAAKWKELFPAGGRAHGKDGTVYAPVRADGGETGARIAVWRDEVVVVADDDAQAELILDRIEGRGLHGQPVLDESMTYGEIYGIVSPQRIADLLAGDQPALAERLRAAADRIELHVDTRRDVGVVADVRGPSGEDARDLGKALGAALALGRLKAQADGNADLAELLELARVRPGEEDFRMELGLPLEVLQKHLSRCGERRRQRLQDGALPPEGPQDP